MIQNILQFVETTPLGMPQGLQVALFASVIPLVFSIIFILIFGKFMPRIFLKIKGKIFKRYKDAYIDIPQNPLTKKKFIIRYFYTLFLILGFMAFLIPAIDSRYFLGVKSYDEFVNMGIEPYYTTNVLLSIMGIIYPIAIGLWTVGWVLEDSSIMHYKFDERPGKLYEIEPLHLKYTSFLKGYAGISSIIFFIQLILYYRDLIAAGVEDRVGNLVVIIFLPVMIFVWFIPLYLIYTKFMKDNMYLREGLSQIKILTEEDIHINKNEKKL